MPWSTTVREHMMIAHSLDGEVFGPARNLHGATFLVDATFTSDVLDPDGIVLDIGRATAVLRRVTGGLSYRNLDDDPSLAGVNTTTEQLCRVVADRLADLVAGGAVGPTPATTLTVTLHESHVAWASFSRPL